MRSPSPGTIWTEGQTGNSCHVPAQDGNETPPVGLQRDFADQRPEPALGSWEGLTGSASSHCGRQPSLEYVSDRQIQNLTKEVNGSREVRCDK